MPKNLQDELSLSPSVAFEPSLLEKRTKLLSSSGHVRSSGGVSVSSENQMTQSGEKETGRDICDSMKKGKAWKSGEPGKISQPGDTHEMQKFQLIWKEQTTMSFSHSHNSSRFALAKQIPWPKHPFICLTAQNSKIFRVPWNAKHHHSS
jgi:hypothetical protein